MAQRYDVGYADDIGQDEDGAYVKYEDYAELEAAAAELLEYAKDNKPHGEESQWLGPYPIDVMEKLLK